MPVTDVVVVGGGIGGASLAYALAGAGLGVTVLDATEQFPDRVRGESLVVWGVAKARRLRARTYCTPPARTPLPPGSGTRRASVTPAASRRDDDPRHPRHAQPAPPVGVPDAARRRRRRRRGRPARD